MQLSVDVYLHCALASTYVELRLTSGDRNHNLLGQFDRRKLSAVDFGGRIALTM